MRRDEVRDLRWASGKWWSPDEVMELLGLVGQAKDHPMAFVGYASARGRVRFFDSCKGVKLTNGGLILLIVHLSSDITAT